MPSISIERDFAMFEEKFELQEFLGQGSFARVHKCKEIETGKIFAVKQLSRGQDFSEMEAIKREVEIWQGLDHERIVSLYRTFKNKYSLFLVCECVDGGSLFEEIVGQKLYSEDQARFMIKQLLEALEYLHGKRIVHRDVKPDNLLICRTNDDYHLTIKLADFGLARQLPCDADVIRCDASGAPLFLAPETILEDGIGLPVDMWACGVILYILLVGYPPFWSSNDEKLLLSILQGGYAMPSPYWDNVSDDAKDLVRKLLVVEPSKRLTASEALKHPWIQNTRPQLQRRPVQRRNFAAVISGVRAMLKFQRKNLKDACHRRNSECESLS